jgi:hypothetical protein
VAQKRYYTPAEYRRFLTRVSRNGCSTRRPDNGFQRGEFVLAEFHGQTGDSRIERECGLGADFFSQIS